MNENTMTLEEIEHEVRAQLTRVFGCGEWNELTTIEQLAADISYMSKLEDVDLGIIKPMIEKWLAEREE